ncbi:hypothetical protein CTEN210_04294 [Chaetoceros tenuissimus]|uniref:Uncharacterized protein n=1 Tax=Chaetoceros tenuissimus TaxID=426638 RepID=A0AAD3CLK7_9STRA|nr:hypothetical protein CTEN210_04294 [Chaetoceros tenuissimus]
MNIFSCCKGSSRASAVILDYYGPAEQEAIRESTVRSNNNTTKIRRNEDRPAYSCSTTSAAKDTVTAHNFRESFLPSSGRRVSFARNIIERESSGGVQITAGSWGLNDSIKLKTKEDKNPFTFKRNERKMYYKKSSHELMTSFEKKTISFRIRRAVSRRSTKTLPRQTLEKHVSIKSFYSEETVEQKEARRENYRECFELKNSDISQTDSKKELQNKIIDWNAKFANRQKMRKMANFVEMARRSIIISASTCDSKVATLLRRQLWLESFVALDPRRQIHSYFTEVARKGGPLKNPLIQAPMSIIEGFRRAASFSVWRPTSNDAISLMMKGQATGKGLEVKGKSAKCGRLSGLIPFIQIYEERHKNICKLGLQTNGRVHVYFKTESLREAAVERLEATTKLMMQVPQYDPIFEDEDGETMEFLWEVQDYGIHRLTESGYGIDVSERVFYQACVIDQDISRTGDLETGRQSEPNFQAMNFDSTRSYAGIGPRTVVYQTDEVDPLKPQTFVVAYEENKTVAPVASDFDCFTVGTRGVIYDEPMDVEQVELMKWMIESIDTILDEPISDRSWASYWFDVLDSSDERKKIDMPRFGFGDPKSYQIMEGAVTRFAHNKNGAVRHGAECFNYKFPQEIDDKLLVIADYGEIDGTNRPFKYMTPSELQEFMLDKLDEGFVFPLNPKWIIADVGWKRVYEKMMISKNNAIQKSLETWYPKASGVRNLINQVYEKHPNGFINHSHGKMEGTEALDLTEQQLRRRKILRRALLKVRICLWFQQVAKAKKLSTGASIMTGILKDNRRSIIQL